MHVGATAVATITDSKEIPGATLSGSTKERKSSWALISSGNTKRVETKRQPKVLARRGKSGKGQVPRLPPQLNGTPICDHVFRFINSARGQKNISYNNLAGVCGAVGTIVNSKVQPIASSLKVKKITVWPGGDSTQQTAEILWNSPITTVEKDNTTVTSMPLNITVSAPFVSRPPKGTFARDWVNVNTNGSAFPFGINCPIGSVIDVHLVFTLANSYSVPSNTTVAAAALGGFYYLALDNATYIPQGVTTTL
jgi:hypothetical protein